MRLHPSRLLPFLVSSPGEDAERSSSVSLSVYKIGAYVLIAPMLTEIDGERIVATGDDDAVISALRLLSLPDGPEISDELRVTGSGSLGITQYRPHSCPVIYGGANL
jgi:hypothetical protein